MEKGDRHSSHSIATELHGGDIDIPASQRRPDIADHSGPVIIIHQEDVSFRKGFNEKIVQLDDSQLFSSEECPCDIVLLHLRPHGQGDQAGKVLSLFTG